MELGRLPDAEKTDPLLLRAWNAIRRKLFL
jgi:hypothetical protein